MQNKIVLTPNPKYPSAKVSFRGSEYSAVVGRSGVISVRDKYEGDGCTPIGSFNILGIYYRPDRLDRPISGVPAYEINSDDIWVDDTESSLYNKPCKLADISPDTSHERLYRNDHLYDVFLDIDYNRTDIEKGKGSAIFMHVARNEQNPSEIPTAGCIALNKLDLLEIILHIDETTFLRVELV